MDVNFFQKLSLQLFFHLLLWCITLIVDIEKRLHSWANPTWSRRWPFWMHRWSQFASILLRIFVPVFISDRGLYFSLRCYLCLVLVSRWCPFGRRCIGPVDCIFACVSSSPLLGLRHLSTGLTGFWVVPGLGSKQLEGGFHSGTCWRQGLWWKELPEWPLPVPVSPGWVPVYSCVSWRGSKTSTKLSDSGSGEMTAFALGLRACRILCAFFKSDISISPSAWDSPK